MAVKRIAYIGIKGLPSKAGADRVVEAIVRGLDKEKYQPVVYCCHRIVPSGTQIPGVKLVRIATLPGKYIHAPILFLLSALHALIFGRYALVHVHNVEACFVLPILRLRYKVISTSHGSAQLRDKWGKWAKRIIQITEIPFVRFSNIITSVSKPLVHHYVSLTKKPVHHIPNGVDLVTDIDIDSTQALLDKLGVVPQNYILFAAGRNIPTKGCHFLLQAFARIESDMQLIVVGDASHLPDFERKLEMLADKRVHFVPFIADKATLMGLLKMCHFFVFPSTVEAMSMMLLEAAEVGTPVICSDIPENTNVLPELALYFESGNVEQLRSQIACALTNPHMMATLANEAQEYVSNHYRWDDIIHKYQILYRRLDEPSFIQGDKPLTADAHDNELFELDYQRLH